MDPPPTHARARRVHAHRPGVVGARSAIVPARPAPALQERARRGLAPHARGLHRRDAGLARGPAAREVLPGIVVPSVPWPCTPRRSPARPARGHDRVGPPRCARSYIACDGRPMANLLRHGLHRRHSLALHRRAAGCRRVLLLAPSDPTTGTGDVSPPTTPGLGTCAGDGTIAACLQEPAANRRTLGRSWGAFGSRSCGRCCCRRSTAIRMSSVMFASRRRARPAMWCSCAARLTGGCGRGGFWATARARSGRALRSRSSTSCGSPWRARRRGTL
jgi:hypothetical protein